MASTQTLVRPYESSDRDGFLSLYESVWDRSKGRAWFEWRFESNPYRDGVQMIVAESAGEIVGAEPLLPYRLRIGSTTIDAYQPVDWIVHPDHRRQGLFTRMTERLLDRYADDATLLFNFPSEALRPGLKKFDWQTIGTVPTSYRLQNPSALLYDSVSPTTVGVLAPLLTTARTVTERSLQLYAHVTTSSSDIEVKRYESIPVEPLERLYVSCPPDQIHVERNTAFLQWRFNNPYWETTTYVARRDDRPVASIVTGTERYDGCTTTMLLDAQPMVGRESRIAAFGALLEQILEDNRDADVVKILSRFPSSLLRRYGFWRDTAIPLSQLPSVSTVVVRPLRGHETDLDGTDPWQVAGRDTTDPRNWHLSLADLDIE